MDTTTAELLAEMHRLSAKIDDGIRLLYEQTQAYAIAEDAYRRAKAMAWTTTKAGQGPKSRVSDIEAAVDILVADERHRRNLAEGLRDAAVEALRSRRAQLSAVQTVANALKAEAELAKYGSNQP